MRFGRGRWHWYDLVFSGLAFVIVYPDKVLDWISQRTGKVYHWRHLIALEVIAIGLMLMTTLLLMPVYPNLKWWFPVMLTTALGLFRVLLKFLLGLFGFD